MQNIGVLTWLKNKRCHTLSQSDYLTSMSSVKRRERSRRLGRGCFFTLFALTAGVVFSPVDANAQVINIASQLGLENNGVFTGSLEYTFTNASTAKLVVNLLNSNASNAGGKLTAFAFNNPGNKISGVSLSSSLGTMSGLLGGASYNNTVSGSPFGNLDIGATTGSGWIGGGSPNGGIQRGNSATFTFNLTGSSLNTLTTNSFINELNSSGQFFAVRFRGFDNGGSDKVAGKLAAIPEPAFYQMSGLLLMGGTGLFLRNRRGRRSA
jgi:hypothetical protein